MRRLYLVLFAGILLAGLWAGSAAPARAQGPGPAPDLTLNPYYYYPYRYFPFDYWPTMLPRWPEPPGAPYMRPPVYMAYPPFKEPQWRYEWLSPQRFYRGNHFWLDQF